MHQTNATIGSQRSLTLIPAGLRFLDAPLFQFADGFAVQITYDTTRSMYIVHSPPLVYLRPRLYYRREAIPSKAGTSRSKTAIFTQLLCA
jgi:hypothetical protein